MRTKPGFTILELLLVLAILVTVASLATPHIGATLDSHRLRSGGEAVRVAWSRARVRAMEKGRTYVFRYELAGSKYVIEPSLSQDDYLESSQLTAGGAPLAGAVDQEAAVAGEQDELPENVTFAEVQMAEDARAFVLSQSAQLASSTNSDVQWSSPVFFYPDGTASTAKLRLVNNRDKGLEVMMRGLTGVIYVKPVVVNDGP